MGFIRQAVRTLPDGRTVLMHPFHISMEGLESQILCRDESDYDFYVKDIFVCSLRCNVIVIMYAVVSNHAHIAVLAICAEDAKKYGEEVKRIYGMYYSRKYGIQALESTDVDIQSLNDDQYVRNALAYIIRNALDNCNSIREYKWTGFRATFRKDPPTRCRLVKTLTVRETKAIFHTHQNLKSVPWLINENNELEPWGACDMWYLEEAFFNNEAFFMKTVGGVNMAAMEEKLVIAPRKMILDNELLIIANETAQKWFSTPVSSLSVERKINLVTFLSHTQHTTISQLARVIGLPKERVAAILSR